MKRLSVFVLISLVSIASFAESTFSLSLWLDTTNGSTQQGCIIKENEVDQFPLGEGPWKRVKTQYTKDLPHAQSVAKLINKYRDLSPSKRSYKSVDMMKTVHLMELLSGFPIITQGGQMPSEGNGSAPGPGDMTNLTLLVGQNREVESLLRFGFKNCLISEPQILKELINTLRKR